MEFSKKLMDLASEAEKNLAHDWEAIDQISFFNTQRVLESFQKHKVSDMIFAGTSGYGYNDVGRDTAEAVYADLFGCEAALVRHSIVNGTHAISAGLFALLRPGDILLSITGKPYDTLEEAIGIGKANGDGSLADFGVEYREVGLKEGKIDFDAVEQSIKECKDRLKVVYMQRSSGYMIRPSLSAEEIGCVCNYIKQRTQAYIAVDNCYGEFADRCEPSAVGADLVMGSLIKNPGGGMVESGGYLAGSKRAVELASYRLTSVGIGAECGATLGVNKSIFKGLFYAPHSVAQAIKTAKFAAYIFASLGYEVDPDWRAIRHDIIQKIHLKKPEKLIAFCKGLQAGSPVDSFVTPEPWEMPGYADKVIMAAGTFTQGASIELSADGPLREPYTVFMQGGLTYESGKFGILCAAEELLKIAE